MGVVRKAHLAVEEAVEDSHDQTLKDKHTVGVGTLFCLQLCSVSLFGDFKSSYFIHLVELFLRRGKMSSRRKFIVIIYLCRAVKALYQIFCDTFCPSVFYEDIKGRVC